MTHPPHDDDERDAGGPQADPDRHLTQPVQPYDRPAPPAAPPFGSPQPYGRPAPPPWQQAAGPTAYGPPPGPYGPPGHGQHPYGQPGPGRPAHGQPAYGPSAYGQPPYAQPAYGPQYGSGQPYGWPQPGPPRKSRIGLIVGLTGLALLLIAGVVVTVLALRSTVLDPVAVERDVAAQFEQREGVAIDLTCADEMEVHEGDSYRCTGVTADREEVTLQITITDEQTAAYTWTEP